MSKRRLPSINSIRLEETLDRLMFQQFTPEKKCFVFVGFGKTKGNRGRMSFANNSILLSCDRILNVRTLGMRNLSENKTQSAL